MQKLICKYIRLFVLWTVRNRTDREIQYVRYQQYSIHTCIVYNKGNQQFTGLLPDTTQN